MAESTEIVDGVRSHTAATAAPVSATGFRHDIQGLRALAAVMVVTSHVAYWPSGGFIGIDVFLVISGFLITGILLGAHEGGRLSLGDFYARRIRRLFPAAFVVLAVTVAASFVLLNRPRANGILWDAISSFFFVSNWRFAAEGTDYFQAAGSTSPLQHFWSLSVEEQFYLVWPALLILLLGFATKLVASRARRRFVLGLLVAAVCALSLGHALGESATSPASAYFSTFTRVWELGAGAMLAVAAPLLTRMPSVVRALLGWLGLLGILASMLLIDDTLAWPAPGAALPVLATALVIAAGVGGPSRTLFPLMNPLSEFLGKISYSLYLWHLPVIIFLGILLPVETPWLVAIMFGTILTVSIVSYYLIEQPFLRAPWLRRFSERGDRAEAWRAWRERFSGHFMLGTVGILVIATALYITIEVPLGGRTSDSASADAPAQDAVDPDALDPAAVPAESPEAQLQAELAAAVSASEWPTNLSPSINDAIAQGSNSNPANRCFAIGGTPDVDRCTWGDADAPHHLYLVGDSTALAYAPAFKAIAEQSDGQWKATTIGLYGCRFSQVLVQNDGAGVMDACPQRKYDVAASILADSPDLVVVSNAFTLGQSSARAPLSASDLVASTLAETAKYNAHGRLIFLAPPPLGADLGTCYTTVSGPQSCNTGVDAVWQEFNALTQSAADSAGNVAISSLPFVCSQDICPAFAGTIPIRFDSVHLTSAYSERIAPVIRAALVAAGRL